VRERDATLGHPLGDGICLWHDEAPSPLSGIPRSHLGWPCTSDPETVSGCFLSGIHGGQLEFYSSRLRNIALGLFGIDHRKTFLSGNGQKRSIGADELVYPPFSVKVKRNCKLKSVERS